ncbi:MAG: TraE family protein, partial [Bacilli bacterium]|nr:TraE family protein [Bacilli bacterium]
MIKSLSDLKKQEKDNFNIPISVQQVIPIKKIWTNGIFLIGRNQYSLTYKFTDINYAVASKEDKESMFLDYSELLNSFDSGATTKITVALRRINKKDFEKEILLSFKEDGLDIYRKEYNQMLLDKAINSNNMVREIYLTVTAFKKDYEEAKNYFKRIGNDIISHLAKLGSRCSVLDATEKLRILHDFYRVGEEINYNLDIKTLMQRGHNFKDYICPDGFSFKDDYFEMGNRYGRVLFLKEYASYIKDTMIAELTDMNQNLMMSIDVIPIPTD